MECHPTPDAVGGEILIVVTLADHFGQAGHPAADRRLRSGSTAAHCARQIADGDVNAVTLDGLKIESSSPLIRQLQMGWGYPVHPHIHTTGFVWSIMECQNYSRGLRTCCPVEVYKRPRISRSDSTRLDRAGRRNQLPIWGSALGRPIHLRTIAAG
jgi:hypothetical protein